MNLNFYLGIDSSTAVQLYPNFDYKKFLKQIQNINRSRSGKRTVYKWGDFLRAEFTAEFVPSSSALIVNSWHNTNTELLLFVESNGATEVHSLMLTGTDEPFKNFQEPYDDFMAGKIILESY